MRYFKNPKDSFKVYGYDETDHTQTRYIIDAEEERWEEVTDNWPPKELCAVPIVPVAAPAATKIVKDE